MKILVIGSRVPFPLRDGGAIATYQMLREMAAQGAQVTYFTFNTRKHFNTELEIQKAFPFCRVIDIYLNANPKWYMALFYLLTFRNYNVIRFRSKEANTALRRLLEEENFDVIHFEGLYTTSFLPIVKKLSRSFLVLRQHNVEHRIWRNLATTGNFIRRIYFRLLSRGLERYERRVLTAFDAVLCISHADEKVMHEMVPETPLFYYPAGMDIWENPISTPNNPFSISHIGSMEWLPNILGVQWFLDAVWPTLLQEFPSATFHIAGKSLNQHDPRFKAPGVINHGEVADALKFQNEHAIAIVPLASGSGIRMKTLESMALAKPVVSTTLGAEGIPYSNGENILIANSVSEWVNCISMLFSDIALAQKIGMNARHLILKEFSVQSHTRRLLELYQQNIR